MLLPARSSRKTASSAAEKKQVPRPKNRKFRIREVLVMVLFLALVSALGFTFYFQARDIATQNDIIYDSFEANGMLHATQIGNMLKKELNAEGLLTYQGEIDTTSPQYLRIQQSLQDYSNANNLDYIYFLRLQDYPETYSAGGKPARQWIQFVWFVDIDRSFYISPEMQFPLDGATEIRDAFDGNDTSAELSSYNERWNGLLSAFHPVIAGDKVVGVVGVDIAEVRAVVTRNDISNLFIFVVIEIAVIVLLCVIIVVMYRRESKRALESNQAKTDFLSNMSHELRTPLTAILGILKIARESSDLDRIKRDYLVKMNVAANTLLRNINDILDMSKIESGKMTLQQSDFNLGELLESVLDIIGVNALEKQITLKTEMNADEKLQLYADEKKLRQIFLNLLSNAIKFTPPKGTVTVKISTVSSATNSASLEIHASISDTGIGIPQSELPKLFQHFSQIDSSLSRKQTGSGLGLVIVKNMVELMGGTISVESVPDQGTTFNFSVKAEVANKNSGPKGSITSSSAQSNDKANDSATDSISQANAETASETPNLSGKRILLVDDNDTNREIIKYLLMETEAEIVEAEDGVQAVGKFTAAQGPDSEFALVLMDVQMPNMDGIEATEKIRALDSKAAKEVPIIALTANVFVDQIQEVLEAGMDDHLSKPIDQKQLMLLLRKYCA